MKGRCCEKIIHWNKLLVGPVICTIDPAEGPLSRDLPGYYPPQGSIILRMFGGGKTMSKRRGLWGQKCLRQPTNTSFYYWSVPVLCEAKRSKLQFQITSFSPTENWVYLQSTWKLSLARLNDTLSLKVLPRSKYFRYLSTLYSHPEWPKVHPKVIRNELSDNIQDNWIWMLFTPSWMYKHMKIIRKKKEKGQPVSFTDFFGYLVGDVILQKVSRRRLLSIDPHSTEANIAIWQTKWCLNLEK